MNLTEAFIELNKKGYQIINEYVNFKQAWELIKKRYDELTDEDKVTLAKYTEEMSKQDPEGKLTKALISKNAKANGGEIPAPKSEDKPEVEKKPAKEYSEYEKILFKIKKYWGKFVNNVPSFFKKIDEKWHDEEVILDNKKIQFKIDTNKMWFNFKNTRKLWKPIKTEFNVIEYTQVKVFDENDNEINITETSEILSLMVKVISKLTGVDLSNQYTSQYSSINSRGYYYISQLTKEQFENYNEDMKKFKELLQDQPDIRHVHDWEILWQGKHNEKWQCRTCGKTKNVYVD